MPDAVDSSELVRAVRAVLGYARSGGMPAELEAQVAGAVVDALLELQERRRADHRPETFALAQRIARARAAGCSIDVLRERFGKSRSQIHRLLNVASRNATVSRETVAT